MGFEEEIEDVQRQLQIGISRAVTDVSLAILSAVTLGTPVGNPTLWQNPGSAPPGYAGGRARGNWQLAISVAPTAALETRDAGGGATISKGRSRLGSYKLGPKVFIVNNVPYIERLNNGHSTQAPVGFVQRAAQAAVNEINNGRDILS